MCIIEPYIGKKRQCLHKTVWFLTKLTIFSSSNQGVLFLRFLFCTCQPITMDNKETINNKNYFFCNYWKGHNLPYRRDGTIFENLYWLANFEILVPIFGIKFLETNLLNKTIKKITNRITTHIKYSNFVNYNIVATI